MKTLKPLSPRFVKTKPHSFSSVHSPLRDLLILNIDVKCTPCIPPVTLLLSLFI